MTAGLKDAIDAAFEQRQDIKPGQDGAMAEAVEQALMLWIAGRRALPRKWTAPGSSTIGSKRPSCFLSG